MILTRTFTAYPEYVGENIRRWLNTHPDVKIKSIKQEVSLSKRGAVKVIIKYEVKMEGDGMSHVKKYKNLDELNEHFKRLNPNLEAQYNLNHGLSIKLYGQPLLGILPPNIDHVDHWYFVCQSKAIGEKATADLLTDVMMVTGQLLDQFDQFGMDDDF